MRLLFAALLLVGTLFSGCQQRVKPTADDILSSCTPACYSGASGMSVHQLYVGPAHHHNLYLIRRVPLVFFELGPAEESILPVQQTHVFVMDKLYAPSARWERAVLPRGMPPKTWSLTSPPIFPVHLSLHL
jgi:hypothetical protein